MHFDPKDPAHPHLAYNMLIGLVAPRPIAWITSRSVEGKINAAPFSAFNYMGTEPPLVSIGVGNRPGPNVVGKDTAQNIRNVREFVINVVDEALAEKMNVCGIDFPQGVNELEKAGLTTAPSDKVSVPRIAEAPAALECREYMTIEIGRSRMIVGEVVSFYVRDEFVDPAGPYVRAEALHAIGRMNGRGSYVHTRDAFLTIPRIPYEEWKKTHGE